MVHAEQPKAGPLPLDLPTIGGMRASGIGASEDNGLKRADQPPGKKRGDQLTKTAGSAHAARQRARGDDDLAAHHYRAIIESSDDAILSKNLNGVILS
jgi:hypothetical protein